MAYNYSQKLMENCMIKLAGYVARSVETIHSKDISFSIPAALSLAASFVH